MSLIYSNALSFRSGDIFFFSSRVNLLFLQAPGHTNARCQCSIDASARRLTRGVCTRVHIGAVHFDSGGGPGESRCRVKKETDMATSAKETVQLLLKAPLIFHPLIIHPSSLFHPKPIDYIYIYIYSALNENFPNHLPTIY